MYNYLKSKYELYLIFMEKYNYVFIELKPIILFNLKNKGYICETIKNQYVYCSNNLEHLNIKQTNDNYLVILKKEKKRNILSNQDIYDNNEYVNNEYVDNIINTEWSCIWIEPFSSSVYENYYTTIESYNLAEKIENIFYNSISLEPIYRNNYDWFYGFNEFPYHINNSLKTKVEDRKEVINTEINSYFLPSNLTDFDEEYDFDEESYLDKEYDII